MVRQIDTPLKQHSLHKVTLRSVDDRLELQVTRFSRPVLPATVLLQSWKQLQSISEMDLLS